MWSEQIEHGGLEISSTNIWYLTNGVWRCPSARWSHFFTNAIPLSYGYNAYGLRFGADLGLYGHPHSHGIITPIAESEVVVPSEMIAIGDCFKGNSVIERESLVSLEKYGNALARHQGRANVVFCDGHVESPTLQFLFEDTSDAALVRRNRDHLPHREKLSP